MNFRHGILLGILTITGLSLHAQVSTDYPITMSDRIILNATLVTPSTAPPQNGFPAVVFIHGLGGNKADLTLVSTLISGRGFACLLYDVRGQGTSGGLSTIMGERETQDLREILAFLQSVPGINPQLLGVAGGSQGGRDPVPGYPHQCDVFFPGPGDLHCAQERGRSRGRQLVLLLRLSGSQPVARSAGTGFSGQADI